jgi:hypothetical protein
MNETTHDTLGQIVRYIALAASGGAISHGYTTENEVALIAGALVTLATAAYGIYKRVRAAKAAKS